MKTEEQVTRELYAFYRSEGHAPGDALERVASVLAWEPAMFTRMISVFDDLRKEYDALRAAKSR